MREEVRVSQNNLLSRVLPQFYPSHWQAKAPNLVSKEFASSVRIGYVTLCDGGYSYLMQMEFDSANVTHEELHQAALGNLRTLSKIGMKTAETPGGPELFLTGINDSFQAVRILLPNVQDAIARILGDEYYCAIPCRDWFICWSKLQSPEWQQHNIETALADFVDDDYRLTPDILLSNRGIFSVHFTQSVES